MEPTGAELQAMQSVPDVCDWVGLDDDGDDPDGARRARKSLLRTMGFRDGTTPLVRQVCAIPLAAWTAALAAWRVLIETFDGTTQVVVPDTPANAPTAVEIGQAWTLRHVCRLLMNLGPEGPTATTVLHPPPPALPTRTVPPP